MNRKENLDGCAKYMSRLAYDVRTLNAIGHFDINKVSEDFFIPILKKVYGCPDLKNQNQISYNFPAVDLGDTTARISFQVTSDASSGKIAYTAKKFTEHKLENKFDELFILIITQKQSSYTSQILKDEISNLKINFNSHKNIIDINDVVKAISALDANAIEEVYLYLQREFERREQHLYFRQNLENFLEFGRSKIEIEKNSKKYIPSIFVETHSAKEEMRLFSNPLFFYRKIDDRVAEISLDSLNKALSMASQPLLKSQLESAGLLQHPSNLDQLQSRLAQQEALINAEKSLAIPFSHYAEDRGKGYVVEPRYEAIWAVVRLHVEGSSSGVVRTCDKALRSIELVRKKIFLVTGMAGQGKTNFICDLIENQFRAFEVPSVFIPARELNGYPAPNRIFNFMTNNRYAPKVSTLHDLLELLNSIAIESRKPFIIAIDGINEVSALDEFNNELKIFLAAVCQYDYVKVIITCRSEFFDSKFSTILDESFKESIHRISDLKSKMSKGSKSRMLHSYLKHFKIKGSLSTKAAAFLKNDLLLIRIFCELYENSDIGHITEIYKGDLFEKYLIKKFAEFPEKSRLKVLPTLYKLVGRMIAENNYAAISVGDISAEEIDIVQSLVASDVVLRQEVPNANLSTFGTIVVSFTYDELRDFIVAHYLVNNFISVPASLEHVLGHLKGQPPYEGVFKYVYILARRQNDAEVIAVCEKAPDFLYQFALNLPLLPPDLQSGIDLSRVKALLGNLEDGKSLRATGVYLYHRRDTQELLNITILLDRLNALNNNEHEHFMRVLFSHEHDFGRRDWGERISNLLDDVLDRTVSELAALTDEAVAFFLHAACCAEWTQREKVISHIFQMNSKRSIQGCIDLVSPSDSSVMKYIISELVGMMKEA